MADEPLPPSPPQDAGARVSEAADEAVSLSAAEHRRLSDLAQQAEEYRDRYQRLAAEFDNARKRLDREKSDFSAWAVEQTMRDLLSIMDSFDQALTAVNALPKDNAIVTGVQLIHKQLVQLLQRHGVVKMEATGKPFDPHYHEAVLRVASTEHEEDVVIEEVQTGYLMHGRMLRPALVKIATQHDESNQ